MSLTVTSVPATCYQLHSDPVEGILVLLSRAHGIIGVNTTNYGFPFNCNSTPVNLTTNCKYIHFRMNPNSVLRRATLYSKVNTQSWNRALLQEVLQPFPSYPHLSYMTTSLQFQNTWALACRHVFKCSIASQIAASLMLTPFLQFSSCQCSVTSLPWI